MDNHLIPISNIKEKYIFKNHKFTTIIFDKKYKIFHSMEYTCHVIWCKKSWRKKPHRLAYHIQMRDFNPYVFWSAKAKEHHEGWEEAENEWKVSSCAAVAAVVGGWVGAVEVDGSDWLNTMHNSFLASAFSEIVLHNFFEVWLFFYLPSIHMSVWVWWVT